MFSWNLAYKDSFVFNFGGRLLERKDPSTILNGFNFKVGYQYIAPVKIKKMGFGVRGGFQYSYKAGNYMEKDKYQQYSFGVPIGIISPVSLFKPPKQKSQTSLVFGMNALVPLGTIKTL